MPPVEVCRSGRSPGFVSKSWPQGKSLLPAAEGGWRSAPWERHLGDNAGLALAVVTLVENG